MTDPTPDTPSVCPTCRSTQPAARHTGRWWRLTDGTVDDSRHGPCPDEWHACPAAGSSSPDVTALAKQMGLADDPFFAREYQTNIYVHAPDLGQRRTGSTSQQVLRGRGCPVTATKPAVNPYKSPPR